ncbi:PIR protein [Plasmodium ovale]|uniref:PIR protein n=1 Tax=Plasmodium ovale TaxID=36330 RepID=A0A1D3JGI3_PLAOA|nr:PIR protein [Plasmodium ovale]
MATYVLGNTHLKRLPSNKCYEYLEVSGYFCDKYANSYKSQLKEKIKIDEYTNDFVNSLCKISFSYEGTTDCTEYCNCLYFKIGDTLYNVLNKGNDFSNIIQILNSISAEIRENRKCKCSFLENIGKHDFNKMKIVYDYLKDYKTLESNLQFDNVMCDQDYKEHLEKASSNYEQVYSECVTNNPQPYCPTHHKMLPNFNEQKLKPLNCEKTDVKLDYPPSGTYELELEDVLETSDGETTPTSAIFFSIFLPFLGICFFLLYKFTLFGPWIQNKVLNKSIKTSCLNEIRTYNIRGYNFDHDQINFEGEQINLNYQSS